MPYDLFISYSRSDNEQGRITQLIERIKADFAPFAKRELVPFFDQREIHGMQDWRQRILQGLRESRLLLACLSPAYLKSDYCEWEFVEYLKYEISHLHGFNGVAPIYFVEIPGWDSKDFEQQCAAWVAELRKRQHFDLRPWHDQGEEALREAAVQERIGKLNRQIADTIMRGERAEQSLGNVDAHNPHFIGRTANLRMLRENFVKPGLIGVVTAVNGVGGLGKTALAIEYAHAFADEYGGGRWQVRCAGKDDLRLALAELATPIGFEFTDDEKKSADLQFEHTRRELKKLADARGPHRCLLLLDNVDRRGLLDPAQVARLNGGDWLHVLATTRLGENELHGAHRDRSFLAIDELPPDDALALIESYQPDGRFRSGAERDAAREIVRLLGCFTLAVESAAVYLGQFANDVTCAAFLARLKKEGLEGLDTAASQSSEGVLHGEKRLSATLLPTLERLGATEKLALEFAALLPPDQVPLPWLRTLVAETYPEMERDAEPGYPDPWKNVLRRLFSLRLIQATVEMDADGQPRVVRVHRLLRELIQKNMHDTKNGLFEVLIQHAFTRADFLEGHWHERPKQWEIQPLVAFTSQMIENLQPEAPKLVTWVCQWFDVYDSGAVAERLLRASLSFQREDQATKPVEMAITLSNLGLILMNRAEYQEAEKCMREALAIDEKYREPTHDFIAIRLNNLAHLLQETNRFSEAEQAIRRALALREASLGDKHPDVAMCLNRLGLLLLATGRLNEAEPLLRRALEIVTSILGLEHPYVAAAQLNLAKVLQATNRTAKAEPLVRSALSINETIFGNAHPRVASSLSHLATLFEDTNRLNEAEPLRRRALAIDEKNLGPNNIEVAKDLNNLGRVLQAINRTSEAEALYLRALRISENSLGAEHPDTLSVVTNLAILLESTERFKEGIPLRRRVIEAQERTLGSEHPDTLRSWNNHSAVLRKQGHAEQAEPIARKVATTTARVLGECHPLTINRYANLALTLIMLGKLEEARQILAANWSLNAPPHANTTPRIAFLRHLIALLESQPDTAFLGQLKTLLTGPELPAASDVAVPWDIAYFIEFLKPKLGEHNAEFLTALLAALNDRTKLPKLEKFPAWRDVPPLPLE